MSQSFSLSRFGRLFSKHTAEHLRGYLLATGVVLGMLALVMSFASSDTDSPFEHSEQAAFFILGLFITGPFFTSTVFATYGNKRQATANLMLPASHEEKFLVGWLYSIPVFLLVYIGCFYLVDGLVLQFDVHQGPDPGLIALFSNQEKLYLALIAYAVISSGFLWGSIFFQKQHFIRTAFAGLLGGVVLVLVNSMLARVLVSGSMHIVMPFSGVNFQEGEKWYSINLPHTQTTWVLAVVPLGLMLLCWAGAYARLKEKEV